MDILQNLLPEAFIYEYEKFILFRKLNLTRYLASKNYEQFFSSEVRNVDRYLNDITIRANQILEDKSLEELINAPERASIEEELECKAEEEADKQIFLQKMPVSVRYIPESLPKKDLNLISELETCISSPTTIFGENIIDFLEFVKREVNEYKQILKKYKL